MTNETRGGEPIRILITTDENYIPPLKVLLTSLRISNPQDEITVYLMHRAVSGEKQEELLRFCEKLRLVFIPVPVGEDAFSHAPVMKQYPREMYFRLLAPHYLPPDISRVLYLDPDTPDHQSASAFMGNGYEGMPFCGCGAYRLNRVCQPYQPYPAENQTQLF